MYRGSAKYGSCCWGELQNRDGVERYSGAQYYSCHDVILGEIRRYREDGNLADGRMQRQNGFHFGAGYVFTAAPNHVFDAIDKSEPAVCFPNHSVAGVYPTLRRRDRLAQIAQ